MFLLIEMNIKTYFFLSIHSLRDHKFITHKLHFSKYSLAPWLIDGGFSKNVYINYLMYSQLLRYVAALYNELGNPFDLELGSCFLHLF